METPNSSVILDVNTHTTEPKRAPLARMSSAEWKDHMKEKAHKYGIENVSPEEMQKYILTNAEIQQILTEIHDECKKYITSLSGIKNEESKENVSIMDRMQQYMNKWTLLIRKASTTPQASEQKTEYISLLGNDKDENLLYAHFDDLVIPQENNEHQNDCDPLLRSMTNTMNSEQITFTHDSELNEKAMELLLNKFHFGLLELCRFHKDVKYILRPKRNPDQKE